MRSAGYSIASHDYSTLKLSTAIAFVTVPSYSLTARQPRRCLSMTRSELLPDMLPISLQPKMILTGLYQIVRIDCPWPCLKHTVRGDLPTKNVLSTPLRAVMWILARYRIR